MTLSQHPICSNTGSVSSLLTTLAVSVSVFATTVAHAQDYTLTTLATFGGTNPGAHPQSSLVFDKKGNLYGTTSGGDNDDKYGTVFRIDRATHILTTVAAFAGANGATPCGALVIDKAGSLYGTTQQGGSERNQPPTSFGDNVGSVFKIAAGAKTITTLARFDAGQVPGCFPEGLTLDTKGHLYGATPFTQLGPGTLFKIASDTNAFTELAQFDFKAGEHSPAIRSNPTAVASLEGMVCPGVAVDRAGNLYGTVAGSNTFPLGFVYEIKAVTNTPVILASFSRPNGWRPNGCLALDSHGNLYGTTREGGEHDRGTVFVVQAGTRRIVIRASFDGSNGSSPETGVIIDRAGNLYGTTRSSTPMSDVESSRIPSVQFAPKRGGSSTGTVFKIAAGSKTITTLARFVGIQSAFANAVLTMDGQGSLYGVTSEGGPRDDGTVFKLTRVKASSKHSSPTARQ